MDLMLPGAHFDLNMLVILAQLLRTRSVTRTARHMGVSQPAISRSLAQLRELLGDPLLVRLEWKHDQSEAHTIEDGELTLGNSPFDPVADLPVRRLVRMEYEKGKTESNGTVLRSIPGDWLLPFLHQRYDDPAAEGIEV